jgi:hypothetical protein
MIRKRIAGMKVMYAIAAAALAESPEDPAPGAA